MWQVVAGATQLTHLGPEVQVRQIKQLRVHEHYTPGEERNDIALLKLDQPVLCSHYVQLGCVPDPTLEVSELKTCYIAGWSSTTARGELPKRTHALKANLAHQGDGLGFPTAEAEARVRLQDVSLWRGSPGPLPKARQKWESRATWYLARQPQRSPREGLHPPIVGGMAKELPYALFLSVLTVQRPSNVLQEAKVHLIDAQLCNSSLWYTGAVHTQNLCAGYPVGGINPCQVGVWDKPLRPQQGRQPVTLPALAAHSCWGFPPLPCLLVLVQCSHCPRGLALQPGRA